MSVPAAYLRAAVLENARIAVEQDPVRLAAETEERQTYRRFWRALVLAPGSRNGLEVAEALLRGESVPLDRLDPEWVRRFRRLS